MVLTFYIVVGILLAMLAASLVWWVVDAVRGGRKNGAEEEASAPVKAKKSAKNT